MIEEILDILLDRRLISIVTLLVACFILRDVVRTLVFIFRRRPVAAPSEVPGEMSAAAARAESGGEGRGTRIRTALQPPASRSASSSGSYPSSERALEMSQQARVFPEMP